MSKTAPEINTDLDREKLECQAMAIRLNTIAYSPTNPRKTFPEAEQAELVESIKKNGVIQPVLVRLWPESYTYETAETPIYELIAGERRARAALAAGRTYIPALIRTLTDQQVLEMQIIENLQRKDLHPLEEAEGYGLMMKSEHAYSADQLAEKIGKSRAYIYGKLKLLDLCDDAKRIFRAGGVSESVALLLARIPSNALQNKALKEVTERDYNEETMSARRAARHIRDRYMLQLDRAPFPIDSDALNTSKQDKKPACSSCPQRTGAQPELYADVESADVCTNPDCFAEKKAFWMEEQANAARAQGKTVLTGEDAEKVTFDSHKFPDSICYEDPERRTYRELMGDESIVLVQSKHTNELLEKVPVANVHARLKEQGVEIAEPGNWKQQQEARKAAAEAEQEKRQKTYDQIRPVLFGLAGKWPISILRLLLKEQLEGNLSHEMEAKLIEIYGIQSDPDSPDAETILLEAVDHMSEQSIHMMMMDLWALPAIHVWGWDTTSPNLIAKLADALEKLPKEPEPTQKPAKSPTPAKTAAPVATKAAQARGKAALGDTLKKAEFKAKEKPKSEAKAKPKTTKPVIKTAGKPAGTKPPTAAESAAERCTKTLELPLPESGK